MGCRVLYNKPLITLNAFQDMGFLNGPFANVRPFFVGLGIFFLCMRGLPPGLPLIRELFDEICFDPCGRLQESLIHAFNLRSIMAFAGARKKLLQ